MLDDSVDRANGSASSAGAFGPAAEREPETLKFDPAKVISEVRANIFGQEDVLPAIEDILYIASSPICDPSRPLFVALFLGPTGVGKTELIRVISQAIYGTKEHFCRIDMNTLSQAHYSAAITGAPPGYAGSKEGHSLLSHELIEGNGGRPGLVLFDEVEKASDPVILSLMNIFDNGWLTLTSGERSYNFRNAIIFMTSNLGARELQRDRLVTGLWARAFQRFVPSRSAASSKFVNRVLRDRFLPEFLNRIDETIVFRALKKNSLHLVIDKRIKQLQERLSKQNVQLIVANAVRDAIIDCGFDSRYGARGINRSVRRLFEIPLARFLFQEGLGDNVLSTPHVIRAEANNRSGAQAVRFEVISG
ncbi:AAA family ATPase [Salinisphaera sp. SWV1]|uniref:AAA family ATPase n=1 Tax=unclassified Salinisphaera TaxID=2649847 RepID=UPI003F846C07